MALASGVPLLSGILAGVIGGILVGMLSGSQVSVSGPAAGMTAVVATQIDDPGVVRGVLDGRGGRGADADRPGPGPGRVHGGLLPVRRDQRPAVRHRRAPDPQADPPRAGPRPRPGRGNGVLPTGPREHVLRALRDHRGHPTGRGRDRPPLDRVAGRLEPVEAAEDVDRPRPPGRGAPGRRARPPVPATRRTMGRRAEPPGAGADRREPGRLPPGPASSRLLPVVESGGLHRRPDHRLRGVAGDVAEPGSGRQARPSATDLAPEPGTAGPGDGERGLRPGRRAPGHAGDRPQLREHQRRGPGRSSRRSCTASCCWSASCCCPRG